MALTDKKRRFVDALLSGLSGTKAAIHAGYSENGAAQAAARLMRDKHVLAALGRISSAAAYSLSIRSKIACNSRISSRLSTRSRMFAKS
ncbi:terminase small subunit [Achromobacter xylosoxidans]